MLPATQEAEEAGELPESSRPRLQWAKIVPLYSSMGDRVRLCLKEKKEITEMYALYVPDKRVLGIFDHTLETLNVI